MKIRVAKFYTESEGSHTDFSKKNLEQHKSKSQGIFFIKYVFEIHKIKTNLEPSEQGEPSCCSHPS